MLRLPFAIGLKSCRLTACAIIMPAIALVALMIPASGSAQVVATAPYTIKTFATAPTGLSKPDSITFNSTNVFVGYGNGGAVAKVLIV